jgi:hypothetical protein
MAEVPLPPSLCSPQQVPSPGGAVWPGPAAPLSFADKVTQAASRALMAAAIKRLVGVATLSSATPQATASVAEPPPPPLSASFNAAEMRSMLQTSESSRVAAQCSAASLLRARRCGKVSLRRDEGRARVCVIDVLLQGGHSSTAALYRAMCM